MKRGKRSQDTGCGISGISHLASRITHPASRVERSPEIPGGHRTVRAPFLADLRELFRRRQFSPAKGFRETFLDAVISDGPDIEAAQFEKQQHLHRPPP